MKIYSGLGLKEYWMNTCLELGLTEDAMKTCLELDLKEEIDALTRLIHYWLGRSMGGGWCQDLLEWCCTGSVLNDSFCQGPQWPMNRVRINIFPSLPLWFKLYFLDKHCLTCSVVITWFLVAYLDSAHMAFRPGLGLVPMPRTPINENKVGARFERRLNEHMFGARFDRRWNENKLWARVERRWNEHMFGAMFERR